MRITRRTAVGGLLATAAIRPAFAAGEKTTYLFPAPSILPAFIPFQLAMKRGYYAGNKLDVVFHVGHGGADVAKQVGVGNADLGGGVGETSMIVRPNGLPVRAVAQLGSHSLFEIAVRKAANIHKITDLRGKKIGVISYQDTGYYALLAVLAANGVKRSEVKIESVGPAGVTQLMIAKSLDGIMAVPEWSDAIESAGVALNFFKVDNYFPAMAQAILTSDKFIKEKPEVVRGFVHAVLHAVRDCISDPTSAAKDYVAFVPQHKGKEVQIERILRRYVNDVYKTNPPSALGTFNPKQLKTIQDFYLKNKIIASAVPINDLYTNEFVH